MPNAIYSCGTLLRDGTRFIPYGVSAYSSGFATVPLDEALAAMQQEIAINDIDQQQPDASRGRWSQSRRDLIPAPFDPNLA